MSGSHSGDEDGRNIPFRVVLIGFAAMAVVVWSVFAGIFAWLHTEPSDARGHLVFQAATHKSTPEVIFCLRKNYTGALTLYRAYDKWRDASALLQNRTSQIFVDVEPTAAGSFARVFSPRELLPRQRRAIESCLPGA